MQKSNRRSFHDSSARLFRFPILKKAGREVELVDTLLQQHLVGRKLTDRILELSQKPGADPSLFTRMQEFIHMYHAHAAREDTVLFPAFREVAGEKRYKELGDQFEEREEKLFGKKGFESQLAEVAALEKQMGIYDLKRYTPKG